MKTYLNHLTLIIVAVLLVSLIAGGTYALLNEVHPLNNTNTQTTNQQTTSEEAQHSGTVSTTASETVTTTLRATIINVQEEDQITVALQRPTADQPTEIMVQFTADTLFDLVDTSALPRPGSGQSAQSTIIDKNTLAIDDVVNIETPDTLDANTTTVTATHITTLK